MVENAIIGSGYGRMRDQIMVEKHRQVVDSTLDQDQVMVELTFFFALFSEPIEFHVSAPVSVNVDGSLYLKTLYLGAEDGF